MTEEIYTLLKLAKDADNPAPIYKAIDWIVASVVQQQLSKIIHHEFNDFMGFEKNQQGAAKEKGNSRNGSYERKLGTEYGVLDLNIPRDRDGEFKTKMFDSNQRRIENLDDTIKLLYVACMTQTKIENLIAKLYGNKISNLLFQIFQKHIQMMLRILKLGSFKKTILRSF